MASSQPEGFLYVDNRGPRRRKSSRELTPVDDDEKTPKASAEARAAPPLVDRRFALRSGTGEILAHGSPEALRRMMMLCDGKADGWAIIRRASRGRK